MTARARARAALVALTAAAVSVGVATCSAAGPAGPAAARDRAPTARHFRGDPTVGALFLPGLYPTLHTCTASVISSRHGDVVMTAAHCISGTGAGYRFAPGYRDGATPYGVWSVTGAYGDAAWIAHQDPHRDWAFLTVARRRIAGHMRSLQSVTGGNRLGPTARRGERVTVIGYGVGHGDRPIRCRAAVYRHAGYPAFDCGGYVGGTSGSPWLRTTRTGRVVSGDIGGLHQGGCTPATSYSPPLGRPARLAFRRAAHGRSPDVFPVAGSDGCS